MSILHILIPVLIMVHLVNADEIQSIKDDSISTFAYLSLEAFLEKIPQRYESKYGFSSRDEFKSAQTGIPLRLYTISFDSKCTASFLTPVALNEWRVPVMVNGTICSFLTVTHINGCLKVVEIGGAALALELDQIDKAYQGCHRALLRVDQLRCDIILINCKSVNISSADCIPLKSATMLPEMQELRLLSQNTVLPELYRFFQSKSSGK